MAFATGFPRLVAVVAAIAIGAATAAAGVSAPGRVIDADAATGSRLERAVDALLETMRDGRATIGGSSIEVSGVAAAGEQWNAALEALRTELPAELELSINVIWIDETLDLDALCRRMFLAIGDAPIEFRFASSELRSASHAALERMVDFSRNCRSGEIRISGHTDSSGNSAFNEWLSLQRANAVADYLQSRGVAARRLRVSGKAASEPVADNTTVGGRAQNRRIEFEFRPLERTE